MRWINVKVCSHHAVPRRLYINGVRQNHLQGIALGECGNVLHAERVIWCDVAQGSCRAYDTDVVCWRLESRSGRMWLGEKGRQ